MSRKALGDWGEELVAEKYEEKGYKLVEKNVKIFSHKQMGEIDLILKKRSEIVFVEVKTRTNENFMPAAETVGFRKRTRLLKTIKAYLRDRPEFDLYRKRIDVAIVDASLDEKNGSASIIEDAIQDVA